MIVHMATTQIPAGACSIRGTAMLHILEADDWVDLMLRTWEAILGVDRRDWPDGIQPGSSCIPTWQSTRILGRGFEIAGSAFGMEWVNKGPGSWGEDIQFQGENL